MVDARVYVSQTKVYPTLRNDLFVPLDGCSERRERRQQDKTHDARYGVHADWGRLAALYKIWQEAHHDIIGWMQEARYLSLSQRTRDDGAISGFSSSMVRHYGWSHHELEKLFCHCDIVTPRLYNVQELIASCEISTPRDFYLQEGGTEAELSLMLQIISERYPEKYIHALKFLHGKTMMPWHLFVMRRKIFDQQCAFIFDILLEMRKRLSLPGRMGFQRHNWEFLAEILWNIDSHCLKVMNPHLRYKTAPIIYVDQRNYNIDRVSLRKLFVKRRKSLQKKPSKVISFGGRINIVISFDDHYVRPACATINSILEHTHRADAITLYVIHDERLSDGTRRKMHDLYQERVAIIFCRIEKSFVHDLPLNRNYINVNTYYRMLIHNVIPDSIGRIIYLDTDIVFCDDIVDLWNIDLKGKILGAARDESGKVGEWRLFKTQGQFPYINAGICIVDMERARQRYPNLDFLYAETFYRNSDRITMQDQDILNIAYKNDIYVLPLAWNVPSSVYYRKSAHSDGDYDGIEYAFSAHEREEAIRNPKIIHFTGRQKPWKMSCIHPLKKMYWRAYARTKGTRYSFFDHFCAWNQYVSIKKGRIFIQCDKKLIEIPFSF